MPAITTDWKSKAVATIERESGSEDPRSIANAGHCLGVLGMFPKLSMPPAVDKLYDAFVDEAGASRSARVKPVGFDIDGKTAYVFTRWDDGLGYGKAVAYDGDGNTVGNWFYDVD